VLIGPWVNLKKEVAFVDHIPFAKRDIDNISADTGRYLNEVYRCHPSCKFEPIHDVSLDRFTDRYLWRRQMRRRLLIVTGCQSDTQYGYDYQGDWGRSLLRLVAVLPFTSLRWPRLK
jgi:hypothetical protein